MAINPVRGARDLPPCDLQHHRQIIEAFGKTIAAYGYERMATPIFEASEVFRKTLGADSQVMEKETYTFTDAGGKSLTLRPEGTAAVARAFTNLRPSLPARVFYEGAMFRRERPQKGRLRQFHQVGVELLGEGSVYADAEVIILAARCLDELDLREKPQLRLNTIGDATARKTWSVALNKYFSSRRDELCEESRNRIGKNPLRILDSKEEEDRKVAADAPRFADFISAEAEQFFKKLTELLTANKIKWQHDERLVRGLDYYCHTAFEFSVAELGRQGAVLAGGRYDGLIKALGGDDVPGVGWAAGIERLAELTSAPKLRPTPMLITIGEQATAFGLQLAERLRENGNKIEQVAAPLAKGLKLADRKKVPIVLFLGNEELATGKLALRDMQSGRQEYLSLKGLEKNPLLRKRLGQPERAESG